MNPPVSLSDSARVGSRFWGGAIVLSVVLAAVLAGFFSMVPDSFQGITTGMLVPCIVGSASLMVTLSARHTHIADRIRSLTFELQRLYEQDIQPDKIGIRLSSIGDQTKVFYDRFLLSAICLAFQFAVIPLAIGSHLMVPSTETAANSPPLVAAVGFAGLAFTLFMVGAVLVAFDIAFSRLTMKHEFEYNTMLLREIQDKPTLDSKSTDTVIHFNRLFHRIWHILRLKAKAKKKAHLTELFFVRYFGMLHEEFHFYRNRMLPKGIYKQWVQTIHLNAQNDERIATQSLRDGWQGVESQFPDTDFKDFISKVLYSVTGDTDAVVDGIQHEKP